MSQKFAAFDAQGNITAFYDSVDSPVPAGVTNMVEITQEQWQTCINQPGQWYVASGALAQVPPPTAVQQLAAAQAAQIAILDAACAKAITAGFTSTALGAAHTYPAQIADQQNLSASVLASLMPNLPSGWATPFWCADSTGTWTYANHTAAQIQQAGQDGKAAIIAAIEKKAGLVAQVNAATTVAAVQAIVWS
ncbi:hypothetical protein [Burkholderia pyrrocinia]|uniref:DUF4376 domain-containing protein n=1 Tax=Burkholderia pyrrocinia TaxID=60550 RepID=UPI001589C4F7|nr:hypothetical protein [Burkholderia pyrrocinia]